MSLADNMAVRLTINGQACELDVSPTTTLQEILRQRLSHGEVRNGCGEGVCGACLVLKDDVPVASCLVLAGQADGATIVTANGLAEGRYSDHFRTLMDQLLDRSAFHCGYCGPGFLVCATHLLANSKSLDESAVRGALAGNLCRCSGYSHIVDAVLAAGRGEQVSQPGRREDLRAKLDGSLAFPTDDSGADMLLGGVLWSSHPSARVLAVDTRAAEEISGVVCVLTHRDVPGRNISGISILAADQPILATDRVRAMSDAIALVAATSQAAVDAALAAIHVDYAAEKPITTIERALAEGAPVIAGRNNVVGQFTHNFGDVDAAFRDADAVIDGTYTCGTSDHACLELDGGSARWEGETLILTVPTQTPYVSRRAVARAIAVPESRVRIDAPRVGGSFGRHLVPGVEMYLALLAHRTRRPVRLALSRREALVHGPKRHAVTGHYRLAIKGKAMTALEADLYADAGPYVSISPTLASILAVEAAGAYAIPNQRIAARAVRTNNPAPSAMRGYGSFQASFGIERMVDAASRQLGLDPADLRRRNLVAHRTDGYARVDANSTSWLDRTLDLACERAGARPQGTEGWTVGRGVATIRAKFGYMYGTVDRFAVKVAVASNGTFTVSSDAPDAGTGVLASTARRVAERLSLPHPPRYAFGADLLADPSGTLFATGYAPSWLHTAIFNALEWLQTSGLGRPLVALAPWSPKHYARFLRVSAPLVNAYCAFVGWLKDRLFPYGKDASNPTIGGSRSLYLVGRAALAAADLFRARAFDVASAALGVPPQSLDLGADGVRTRADPAVRISWAALAQKAGGELAAIGTATLPPGRLLDARTGNQTGPTDSMDATHICDVAVEPATGRVKVLRYVAVHDVGRAFDPDIIQGQIRGGIVMGLSQVVGEHLYMSDGVVGADSFLKYLIPTSLDAPDCLDIQILESRSGLGPEGAKGIGEVGVVAATSAMAGAIGDALGVSVDSIPQSPAMLVALAQSLRRPGDSSP